MGGADYTINARELPIDNREALEREVKELAGGDKAVAVIDTVGTTNTLRLGINLVKRGGKIILLGYGKEAELKLPIIKVIYDEIVVEGSRAASKWEVSEVLKLAEKGLIAPNVTDEYRLEDINKALENLRKGRIIGRAVIKFD